MDIYSIILSTLEALLLLSLILLLFYKSKQVSNLTFELLKLRKDENELLRQQSRQNDYFPMLVHELRSPLSVIRGASDLIIKEAQSLSKEQISTLLYQIQNSSNSMMKLVNDILDVSKMESGRFEINKVFGRIEDLLKDTCGYFLPLAKVKNISLECKFEPNLPNCSFDPERIKQVMNNLLSNAIKYTPDSGGITVETKRVKNFVQITVADTGEGVINGDKDKLFQKFVQGTNHNHIKEKGTGLGLVISKGIVNAHGGEVWIEDNQPHGAKFVFSLPLV
jgi:signal transduction histidine kinase